SPFGAHGPAYPALYGSLPLSEVEAHAFFLALAGAAWFFLARPSPPVATLAGLLLATFWPLWLFLPSAMQEPLHVAFAMLLAGLSPKRAAFAVAVLVASLLRASWALVLVPYALSAFPRRRAVAFFGACVLTLLAAKVWSYIVSPYPNHLSDVLAAYGPWRGAR